MTDEKTRENRLRRVAHRQGLNIMKTRSDLVRGHHGGYMVADLSNVIVAGAQPNAFSMSLDDVEKFLKQDKKPKAKKR